jgi:TorA maturation chaperone TorD
MNAVPGDPVARATADAYALLAAVFDGDVELLAAAIGTGVFDRLALAIHGAPDVEALSRRPLDTEALRVGYDNLFVVPGAHYVPPFASGYVDGPTEAFESDSVFGEDGGSGELLGRPAASAASTYERFGFAPTRGADLPDSLPALLEFAGALAVAEWNATRSEDRSALGATRLAFLEEHLWWLDRFADAVVEADRVERVFAELAGLARAFVAFDRRRLAEPVGADESVHS